MQGQPSAVDPRLSGTVRGLGVCDVLRIELEELQLGPLAEAVEAMVRSLELELERRAEVPASEPGAVQGQEVAEYELRLAVMMRERRRA